MVGCGPLHLETLNLTCRGRKALPHLLILKQDLTKTNSKIEVKVTKQEQLSTMRTITMEPIR